MTTEIVKTSTCEIQKPHIQGLKLVLKLVLKKTVWQSSFRNNT